MFHAYVWEKTHLVRLDRCIQSRASQCSGSGADLLETAIEEEKSGRAPRSQKSGQGPLVSAARDDKDRCRIAREMCVFAFETEIDRRLVAQSASDETRSDDVTLHGPRIAGIPQDGCVRI